jgi:hypothetical protein
MLAALTPDGTALLERSAPTHVESVRRRMIDLLDPEELATVARAFQKIRAGLEDRSPH